MNDHRTGTNDIDGGQTAAARDAGGSRTESRTHIVCIVDRSGSMQPIAEDAIGGSNAFLESQRTLPGDAVVTLVLFDHEYFRLCRAVPIAQAPRLDHGNYYPRGTTALLDAIGRTLEDVEAAMAARNAEKEHVIVAILTDGLENSSTDYSAEAIAQRIDALRTEHGWEFIYLGANQDAISVAGRMNIPAASSANFAATSAGVHHAYAMMNTQVAFMRTEPDRSRRRKH